MKKVIEQLTSNNTIDLQKLLLILLDKRVTCEELTKKIKDTA